MDNVHVNGGFNAQLEQQKGITDATLRRDLFEGFNPVSGYGSNDSASKFLPEIEITNDTADTANNNPEAEGDGKAKPTEPSDNGNVPGYSGEPSTKTLRTCTADDPYGTKE